MWYGGSYLYKWDGTIWTMFSTADGLPWNYITALAVDTNGILWIGTQYGLSSYDGTTFTNFFVANSGLTSNYISDIEVDVFNNKWIGTSTGISVYNENGVVMGIEDQGFPKHADISFYPNPAGDFIVVDLSHITTNMISLSITDVLGKELLVVQKVDNFAKIDVSSLSAGIYLGKLTYEKGEILTGKFIVQ